MNITSTLKILVLASLSLSIAVGASAQHVPPLVVQEPMPLMPTQSL